MARSQLAKDNIVIVISKQATTVTSCMERSQVSSSLQKLNLLKFCLLIKSDCSKETVAGTVEAIQSVCLSAACIGCASKN